MKPRGRIRSLIKWTGVAITALLLIVGVASGWYTAGVALEPTIGVLASGGQLNIRFLEPSSMHPRVHDWSASIVHSQKPHYYWQFERFALDFWSDSAYPNTTTLTIIRIPFWFLILLTGVPTLLMFRADRRRTRIGRCPNCGYSRTGLAADRSCPECGARNEEAKA